MSYELWRTSVFAIFFCMKMYALRVKDFNGESYAIKMKSLWGRELLSL